MNRCIERKAQGTFYQGLILIVMWWNKLHFESFGGVIPVTIDNKIIGTPLSNGVFYGEQKSLDSTSTISLKVGLFVFCTISLSRAATLVEGGGEGKALCFTGLLKCLMPGSGCWTFHKLKLVHWIRHTKAWHLNQLTL